MMTSGLCRALGLGALVSLAALGCRHAHCDCDCCDCGTGTVTTTVAVPPPTNLPPVADAKPASLPVETPRIEPKPAVTKDEHEGEEILVTDSAAPVNSRSGSATGTRSLTIDQAKVLGIRPGYTPGALYISTPAPDLADKPASNPEKRPAEEQ
jgi:hypothetical protein